MIMRATTDDGSPLPRQRPVWPRYWLQELMEEILFLNPAEIRRKLTWQAEILHRLYLTTARDRDTFVRA
jgi:hypothetical protein